jgi:hypothetical protein
MKWNIIYDREGIITEDALPTIECSRTKKINTRVMREDCGMH